jgi:hypothetical protein
MERYGQTVLSIEHALDIRIHEKLKELYETIDVNV